MANTRCFIEELPKELVMNILTFLKPSDLLKTASISKGFYLFSNDKVLWSCILKELDFKFDFSQEVHPKSAYMGMKLLKEVADTLKEREDLIDYYHRECMAERRRNNSLDNIPVFINEQSFFLLVKNPLLLNQHYCGQIMGSLDYPIEVASARGWKNIVKSLAILGHLMPISRARALCAAIKGNYIEIVRILIQAGVSVTECDLERNLDGIIDGNITLKNTPNALLCPLAVAIKSNALEIAKLLLEKGASLSDLSYCHPADFNFEKEKHRSVSQLIDEGQLDLSDDMREVLTHYTSKCLR